MSDEGRTRLTSWKEIATYLGREVRTVIRWEKERGLPVHRVPGGQGRSVFAFTDELDRWAGSGALRRSSPVEQTSASGPAARPRKWLLAGAIAATSVAVIGVAARVVTAWPQPGVSDLRLGVESVTALSQSRPLWTFQFPHPIAPSLRTQTAIADLDGDGRADAIAAIDLTGAPGEAPVGALYAIDSRGRLSWTASIPDALTFAAGRFDPPWQPDDVVAFTSHGEPRIAWALHHYTWWPSMLAVFDGHGTRLGTFVNSGWIRQSRPTPDGRYLVTGGFSNSRDAAAFAILDADHPSGRSPEDAGSGYACRNCPAGAPRRYITIQWTDIAATLPQDDRDATVVASANGGLELRAQQRRNVEAIVELSPALTVTRATVSDNFWEMHRRLEADGTLTHSRDRCPFRNGPIVREWTPAGGWRKVGPEAASPTP